MKKWLVVPLLVLALFFTGADFSKTEAASVNQLNDVSKKYLGVRYTYGGSTVSTGFDCSGYTQTVFRELGITLPRTTGMQMAKGTVVSKSNLQAGDLIFFNTSGKGVSHVGIYIGNNQFIHSATGGVQITSLSNSYWKARYMTAKRVGSFNSAAVAKAAAPQKKETKKATTAKAVKVSGKFKTTANLNLRKSASTNGKVLVTIPKGKQVTAVSKTGNWYKVKYGSKTGYVSGSYITKVTAKAKTTTKKTTTKKKATTKKTTTATLKNGSKGQTTANLNLRSGKSTSSKVLVTIPKGKQVSIVSKSGNWYKVKYGKKTGFVSAKYVKAASTKNVTTSKKTSLKTTANLNLRSAKTTSSKVLKLIPKGKQVTVVSKSGNWYKVKYAGKTGFVSASYVK